MRVTFLVVALVALFTGVDGLTDVASATTLAELDALPQKTPSVETLNKERCLPGPIQRTRGRFLPNLPEQALEVDRDIRMSSTGPVCVFGATIVDATNPNTSRLNMSVWGGRGPGQVFADGHWSAPEIGYIMEVKPVHALPGASQQVLIRYFASLDDAVPIHLKIIAFDQDTGYLVKLLDIADPGSLDASIDNGRILLRAFKANGHCHLCGTVQSIELTYDPDAKALALTDPTTINVELFKELNYWAGKS